MANVSYLNMTNMEQHAFISIRLVTMDHYMAEPITSDLDPVYSSFRSSPVKKVPVLRVFGSTSNGQKTCLHIHGILPYMFVPKPVEADDSFSFRLAASLDKALNISLLAGLNKDDNNGKTNQQQHIYKITEVRARPFYGYHPREHSFYKIFFYNPWMVKRAADILQNGAVMGRILQPHFSHIPYTLQFMMDYNLQGMNLIHLKHCLFRRSKTIVDSPSRGENQSTLTSFLNSRNHINKVGDPSKYFDIEHPPASQFLLPDSVERMSVSELEIDVVAVDILNTSNDLMSQTISIPDGMSPLSLTPPLMKSKRAFISGKKKKLTNPGLEALWQDERMRRATLLEGTKEDVESLSPPDSPSRERTSDWKSDSQQFWEDRFTSMITEINNSAMLDKKDEENDNDPDSTANFFIKVNTKSSSSKKSEVEIDPIVYPAEIKDDDSSQFLQEATSLDFHVSSLSQSILGTPPVTNLRNLNKKEEKRNKLSLKKKKLSLDDTVVDEEILSQTISESLNQKENEYAHYFDEDETELMNLLSELGKERSMDDYIHPNDARYHSEGNVPDPETSFKFCAPSHILTKRQYDEDVQDTFEMSQIWDSDPKFDIVQSNLKNEDTNECLTKSPTKQACCPVSTSILKGDHDTEALSSSKLTGIPGTLSPSTSCTNGEDDELFISSQPNDFVANVPLTRKKANASDAKKNEGSPNIHKSQDNTNKDWDDDSFWDSINFDNL